MTKIAAKHTANHFGSKALFTTLALTLGQVSAEEIVIECDSAEPNCQEQAIELIKVHGVRFAKYQVEQSADPRRTAPLLDTPQTITVLTKDQIEESGKSDLKDILAAQAGVTLGTGENGNAFGDRYIIRGHEARSDVFVDGLRDPGMTTRESFATEQIEITKGPSSTFAGRGSSGGAVNSISKKASTSYDFGRIDASLGSDEHHRLVLDYNTPIANDFATRINLLRTAEDAPEREGISRSRQGALLSGVYDNASSVKTSADLYYLKAEDTPDLGSYYQQDRRQPLSDIPVYAQQEDFLHSEVAAATFRIEWQLADDLRFQHSTRYGETRNGYLATGARGTVRDASYIIAPNAETIVLSTHQGWQDVEYFASQFNVFWDTHTGSIAHQWLFGLEISDEQVDNGVYALTYQNASNCRVAGRSSVSDSYCLLDAAGQPYANADSIIGRSIEQGSSDALFKAKTMAAYVMDTVTLNEQWQVFVGLRVDQIDYSNDVLSSGQPVQYAYKDHFYNGHLGVVYRITEQGNVYWSYATATNINGGESDLGANCGYGGLCGDPEQAALADPETVQNIELGTKWSLLDERLFLAAAWFTTTKYDVMESVGDAYSTLGTLNTGKNRIQGVELAMNGNLTDKLSVQASAAIMQSEVLASIEPTNVGLALSNFADESFYLQLRYQLTPDLAVGGDYSYKSAMYGGQPDTAAGYDSTLNDYSIVVPSYAVLGLFANYNINNATTLRLNVGNVTNKEYWTAAYRSGAFMYLGEARAVRATLTYEF